MTWASAPSWSRWFKAKVAELDKLPAEHDRSGISKGERLPDPQIKIRLEPCTTSFSKNFLLKSSARLWASITARVGIGGTLIRFLVNLPWASQKNFLMRSFRALFGTAENLGRSDSITEASQKLINECRYYPCCECRANHYPTSALWRIKKSAEPISFDKLTTSNRFHPFLFSILLLSLKKKSKTGASWSSTVEQIVTKH